MIYKYSHDMCLYYFTASVYISLYNIIYIVTSTGVLSHIDLKKKHIDLAARHSRFRRVPKDCTTLACPARVNQSAAALCGNGVRGLLNTIGGIVSTLHAQT